MVQPRKGYIKSVNLRYSSRVIGSSPGSSQDIIAEGDLNTSIITDTPGGVAEDIPASVTGATTEGSAPFDTLTAGDAFTLTVNGGSADQVNFAIGDNFAGRVVGLINTAVGSTVAFNERGQVRITSTILGSTSSLLFEDTTPGTLAKLGITAGTFNGAGVDSNSEQLFPIRGVVTRTTDSLGGIVPLNWEDGRQLLTDNSSLIPVLRDAGSAITLAVPEVNGGQPIRGRITFDGVSNYTIKYFAKIPPNAEVITGNSDFLLLDAFDTIDISISGSPAITVAFTGAETTAAAVADRINLVWAIQQNTVTTTGEAFIFGSISQPYTIIAGDSLIINSDIGGTETVTFAGPAVTAADVAVVINAQTTGITASASTDPAGTVVQIVSDNSDGRTSSIEIATGEAVNKLGFSIGKTRGFVIADLFGTESVRIFDPVRGKESTVVISNPGPSTLARLGISTGTTNGSETATDVPVGLPTVVNNNGVTFPEIDFLALIPESVEFGEADPKEDDIQSDFEDSVAGKNITQSRVSVGFSDTSSINPNILAALDTKGIKDAGKSAILDAFGEIPFPYLNKAIAHSNKFFKRFLRTSDYDNADIQTVVASRVETPGTQGNTLSKSASFTIDIDPDSSQAPRDFDVEFGGSRFFRLRTGGAEPAGFEGNIDLGNTGIDVALGTTLNTLTFYDVNVLAAGGPDNFVPFSSPTNQTVRIGEIQTPGTPLLDTVNARFTVTCGDGLISFGDFNGVNAIQQAVSSIIAGGGPSSFTIQVKSGTYTVDAGTANITGTIDPSDSGSVVSSTFIFEGTGPDVEILTTSGARTFEVGNNAFILRNVRINTTAVPWSTAIATLSGASLILDTVIFDGSGIRVLDGQNVLATNCIWNLADATANIPCIELQFGDGFTTGHERFVFKNCRFISGDNQPVLIVRASGSAVPITTVDNILFDTCQIFLGSTTVDANGNLAGNCGVIDIDPNGANAFDTTTPTGVIVEHIEWRRCNVDANSSVGPNNILIHLLPSANGANDNPGGTFGPFVIGTDPAIRINNVTIDGGDWLYPSVDTIINPFTIGGVGQNNFGSANFGNQGTLAIRNCKIGCNTTAAASTQGTATEDTGSWFTTQGTARDGAQAANGWGMIAVSANSLEIENLKIANPSQLSDSGELFVKAATNVKIDNVRMSNYRLGGSGTAPGSRARFRFGEGVASLAPQNVVVRKLICQGIPASAGDWTFGPGASIVVYEASNAMCTFEDCEISGFRAPGPAPSAANGFATTDAGIGGLYGTGGGLIAGESQANTTNLHLNRFKIRDVTNGILNFATIAFGGSLGKIEIRECEISDCLCCGLSFNTELPFQLLNMTGNNISLNDTASSGFPGVSITCDDWDLSTVMFMNNKVFDNNTGATTIQVQFINEFAGTGQPINGICMGNSCRSSSVSNITGRIRAEFRGTGATALPSPSGYTSAVTSVHLRGIHTSHDTSVNSWLFTNSSSMAENDAILDST